METRSNNVLVGAFVLFFTAALAFFIVWLANDSGGTKREYDIFFKQSVDGLNKGAAVQFSGVPAGQVREIALWPEDPQFVRVRIEVDEHVPVLQGTTAALEGAAPRRHGSADPVVHLLPAGRPCESPSPG